MDYVTSKILESGVLNLISLPVVVATVLLVAAAWTGLAGRLALLVEDVRGREKSRFPC